jgi:adenosylhomocysteine nucleosidase
MLAIIAAMDKELERLLSEMKHKRTKKIAGKTFYRGWIRNSLVVVALSGIGKVNAAMTASLLFQHYPVTSVINIGVAGGIPPAEVGTLVIATQVGSFDIDLRAIDSHLPFGQMAGEPHTYLSDDAWYQKATSYANKYQIPFTSGIVVSGDQFVNSMELLAPIASILPGIVACEMEAMAIAQVSHHFNIPFLMIRGISDIISHDQQSESYQNSVQFVSDHTALFVLQLLD